jgi:O-antigen ligase
MMGRDIRNDRSGGTMAANWPAVPPKVDEQASRQVRRSIDIDRIFFWSFLVALAWVPFPLGSNRLFGWGVNAVLFGCLVIAYEASLLVRRRVHPVAPSRIGFEMVLFGLVCGWIFFQASHWAPEAWNHPIWAMTSEVLGRPVTGSVSVAPDAGLVALLRLLTVALVFWLALQLCRDALHAHYLTWAIAIIGFGYALYGIVQLYAFPDTILWFERTDYQDSLTSTFINRNTCATYLGMSLLASFALLLAAYRTHRTGKLPLRLRMARIIEVTAGYGAGLAFVAFSLASALMLTGSRAGITSSFIALIALIVLLSLATNRHRAAVIIALLFIVGACAAAMLSFGDHFLDRMANAGGANLRTSTAEQTIAAALDAPWTGFGFGSFEQIFALYRDSSLGIGARWDKAHNTYAELLLELGFPAAITLGTVVLSLLIRIGVGAYKRERVATVSFLAIGVSILVLLHALVDFSIQIEAVAITFWAIMGAGLAQSWSSRMSTT